MRDHVTRRQIPIEQSIVWKPLSDPHYVVASLQPADGGRKKIFIRQQALARTQAAVRSHGRRSIGLLLGQIYQCPTTGADYVVIESISELKPATDENDIAVAVTEAVGAHAGEHHIFRSHDPAQVLGWFRGAASVDAKPTAPTAYVHTSVFQQPWQVTLVIGEGASGGAVFLRDGVNSRWFYAPFYELLGHAPTPNQPKSTFINWPQYLTTDSVTPAVADPVTAQISEQRPEAHRRYERPWLRKRRAAKEVDVGHPAPEGLVDIAPAAESPDIAPAESSGPNQRYAPAQANPPASDRPIADHSVADHSLADRASDDLAREDQSVADRPLADRRPADRPPADRSGTDRQSTDRSLTDRLAARAAHSGLADVAKPARERRISRGAVEKLAIVDDRDQKSAPPRSKRRVSEDEDTSSGDDPGRYIEIARIEGFFIAARFDSPALGSAETLWVMNEPYSGFLLSVVTSASAVIDATLHYNVRTDDEGLKKTPFPEHRDAASKTVYVRETCVDSLRARCKRLRATNALLKEWNVTPMISFLTPAEWESIPTDGSLHNGVGVVSALNEARIAELPGGLRRQFHLGAQDRIDRGPPGEPQPETNA